MVCNSGFCLGTKCVKAFECNMLGPWLCRGRLLRQVPPQPQPSNPGSLEPSASVVEGFSEPHKSCTVCSPLMPTSTLRLQPFSWPDIPFPVKKEILSPASGRLWVKVQFLQSIVFQIKPFCQNPKCCPTNPLDLLSSFAPLQQQHNLSRPDVDLTFSSFLCCSTHACNHLSAVMSVANRLSSFTVNGRGILLSFCAAYIAHAPDSHSCLLWRGRENELWGQERQEELEECSRAPA